MIRGRTDARNVDKKVVDGRDVNKGTRAEVLLLELACQLTAAPYRRDDRAKTRADDGVGRDAAEGPAKWG